MKRKGQAEIFGLIIIVLLLLFSLLFFIKIKQEDTSSVTLRSNFRVNNLLNAVMKVTVSNVDGSIEAPMRDFLRRCLDNVNSNTDSCGHEEELLQNIFGKTLRENEKYKFEGFVSGEPTPLIDLGEGCEEGISASPARFPGGYEFRLKICYS
ncbi:MAG: hypothetical protein KKG75_04880 [Nanoarchaeota archaeon]|nr:hypothetical protein [Nanoarchaeota archaeon]